MLAPGVQRLWASSPAPTKQKNPRMSKGELKSPPSMKVALLGAVAFLLKYKYKVKGGFTDASLRLTFEDVGSWPSVMSSRAI